MSPRAIFSAGKAIRGGVPVCWPWFGAHPSNAGLRAHGLARGRFWQWGAIEENDGGVTLRIELRDDSETLSIWSHPFRLVLTVRIGAALEVVLATHNTGDRPFTLGSALHTYLRVGDIARCRVEGLGGVEYLDTVGQRETRQQEGPVTFDREVDRIYRHGDGCRLVDEAWDRRLEVRQRGAKDLVVWNPWEEKTIRLGDLPREAFRDFVCLEAANADGDLPIVPPGGKHVLATSLSVHPVQG
jgi:D-hexose-6-phosphate mutarotase